MEQLPLRRAGQRGFWGQLGDQEREILQRLGARRRVYAGDSLPASSGPSMTILMADCWIRLQAGRTQARRSIIDIIPPGGLCSALHATHPDSPHWLGDIAEINRYVFSRGEILELTGEIVPALLGDLPNLAGVIRTLQSEQLYFAQQLRVAARLDVEVRLARLLLHLLYRFGEREVKGRNVLAPPVPQTDLAAWAAASETSVARVLGRWRRQGLIYTGYSSLAILDPKRIRDIANAPDVPFSRFPSTRDRRKLVNRDAANSLRPEVAPLLDLAAKLPPGVHRPSAEQ